VSVVGIGVPVMNGGTMLRDALDSILAQTYRNLDIIISDNASDDGTADICREYAARDPRIRYFRQLERIDGLSNFRFCFEQSRADWWMWAAHDDLRSPNFVETLLRGTEKQPSVALVFSDVWLFSDRDTCEPLTLLRAADLAPSLGEAAGVLGRHAALTRCLLRCGNAQLYGLISSKALRSYAWPSPRVGSDLTLTHHLAASGGIRHEPGAVFYFYNAATNQNAGSAYWRRRKEFPWWSFDELAWKTAVAVVTADNAGASELARIPRQLGLFVAINAAYHGGAYGWGVHYLHHFFGLLPEEMKEVWRLAKRVVGERRSG
jgi:glycosyltransferase involved in cell wall biosynthesis